jgi:hypothetical protein
VEYGVVAPGMIRRKGEHRELTTMGGERCDLTTVLLLFPPRTAFK